MYMFVLSFRKLLSFEIICCLIKLALVFGTHMVGLELTHNFVFHNSLLYFTILSVLMTSSMIENYFRILSRGVYNHLASIKRYCW